MSSREFTEQSREPLVSVSVAQYLVSVSVAQYLVSVSAAQYLVSIAQYLVAVLLQNGLEDAGGDVLRVAVLAARLPAHGGGGVAGGRRPWGRGTG